MAKDVEHLKDRVLNLLRFDSNELKPLKSKRIQYHFGMNDAEVRVTVRLLRLDCHPIASGSKGFFYATKANELVDSIKHLKSRVSAIIDVIKKLEDAQERLLDDNGQKLLDFKK